MSIPEQVGQTTRSFFDALKDQPLSLALVVVILAMSGLLYYQTSQTLTQRASAMDMIVSWQRDTDKLMANCVSQDVTKMVIDNIQSVTKTLLETAQKDIERMQVAVDKEREASRAMQQQIIELLRPPPPKPQSFESRPIDYQDCDPLGPFCMPL